MIEIENKKLHDWIVSKDELVNEGRKISGKIEAIEKEIEVFEKKEKYITGKVKPDAKLVAEGDLLAKGIEKTMKRLEELGQLIEKQKLDAIPEDMKLAHKAKMKEREVLERERNKIALKVQKIKDRVVPLIQKEVKPLLKEYDDIETAKTKNGKVIINTFNHLDDWKRMFKSR